MQSQVHWLGLLFVVAFAIFSIVVSVAAILIGVIGRRTGATPICRVCEYDLRGNPQAATCPECGADLKQAGAIVRGHRKWRGTSIVLGLIGTCVAFVAILVILRA